MKKIIRRILGVIPAVAAQLLWLYLLLSWLSPYAPVINLLLSFFAIVYVLYIMTKREESAYKTLWLLIILGLPVFGTILYLILGNKRTARPIQRRLKRGSALLPAPEGEADAPAVPEGFSPRLAQTFHYIEDRTHFRTLPCEQAEYFSLGDEMFPRMLEDLKAAKRFIFAEYFIVSNGKMWDAMVDIMAEKVKQGVDVRFMYDDLGSISTYSQENVRQLTDKGIACVRFNPLVRIQGTINYRDHRKMLIIDGDVVYSGGINLADEYINAKVKYGHWKDTGFRLTGAPVGSYTRMFAEFWNAYAENPVPAAFLSVPSASVPAKADGGYVLSYYDSPLYDEAVSNSLYIELLSLATHYAWFYTPYLLLGDSLLDAFVRAAQRGVDVRIILPGIPDKPFIYRMSRSYYHPLLAAGVKIYEYTPGFVHAKGCVIDDVVGTVGTVNLDYRSLFLHFENNALFYRAPLLGDLKADFAATQTKCRERTLQSIDTGFAKWLLDSVLRILAPLC